MDECLIGEPGPIGIQGQKGEHLPIPDWFWDELELMRPKKYIPFYIKILNRIRRN